MRRRRSDLIKVGAFMLAAGALLAGGLLWIAGSHLLRPVDSYVVLFRESVTGLNAGANVEYQGVVVGRVRDIRLTPDIPPNVAVDVDIEPGTQIRTDTRAALIGSIVTGIKYIQLEGGTEAAQPLPPGGTIPGETIGLEMFRDRFTEVMSRAARVLRRFDEEVLTPSNVKRIGEVVDQLGDFAANLNQAMEGLRAEETGKGVSRIVRNLNDLTHKLDLVVDDFYARREGLFGGVETTVREMDEAARATRELAETLSGQLHGPGGGLDDLLTELTATARRLQEVLDVIRSDPAVLIWGREAPALDSAR